MIDKRHEKMISAHIPAGLDYQFVNGKKHTLLRIEGRLIATLSNRSKLDQGRAMLNVIASIKRVARDLQIQTATVHHR